ncbi:MAG: transcriptional regulator [Deltaproteobacteria bacterium RIFCSPLOWO2_02_FULL_46_8]|nr:MAG: transcriptional regulator [Deltaproteobacteria bacterium RIFCSPLOWO2_02_FULL_46_8]
MCKVFSHPKRLELINILRDHEYNVSELARKLDITVGNLSQHLTMMKQRRVLLTCKEGNEVFYRLANPKLLKAFDLIREILAEQIEHNGLLLKKAKQ